VDKLGSPGVSVLPLWLQEEALSINQPLSGWCAGTVGSFCRPTVQGNTIGNHAHTAVSLALATHPLCTLGGTTSAAFGTIYGLPNEYFSALSYYQFGPSVVASGACKGNLLHDNVSADVRVYSASQTPVVGDPGYQTAGGVGNTVNLLTLTTPAYISVPLTAHLTGAVRPIPHGSSPSSSNSCVNACSNAIQATGCSANALPVCACAESMNGTDTTSITSIFQAICAGPASVSISGLTNNQIQASPTTSKQQVQLNAALQNIAPVPSSVSYSWKVSNSSDPNLNTTTLVSPTTGFFTPPSTLSNNPGVDATHPLPGANPTTVQVQASWDGTGLDPRAKALITEDLGAPTLPVTSTTPLTVTITGSWFAPPASVTFPATVVYSQSQQAVTLTNTGNAELNFSADPLISCGASTSCPYSIASSSCTAAAPVPAGPGQSCTINISFKPTSTSPPAGTLVLFTDSANAQTQTPISGGNGVSIPIQGAVSNAMATVSPSGVGLHHGGSAIFSVPTGANSSISPQSAANVVWSVNGIQGGNRQIGTIAATAATTGTLSSATYSAPAAGSPSPVTISAVLSNYQLLTIQATTVTIGVDVAVSIAEAAPINAIASKPNTVDLQSQAGTGATQWFTASVVKGLSSDLGTVTWNVSGNCGGKACGTYSIQGNQIAYTAPLPSNLAKPATDSIQATSLDESSVFGVVTVEDYLAPQIVSVSGNVISQTVAAGQTATYSLLLTANTGDPLSPLSLTCAPASKLPTGVTCSKVQITPGPSSVPFSITVTTTGTKLASNFDGKMRPISLALIFPFAGLLGMSRRRGLRGVPISLLAIVVACILLGSSGCGTNGTFSTAVSKGIGATPSGTFTVPIVSTSTGEAIAYAQLIVQ
jgi:hypothetical protein